MGNSLSSSSIIRGLLVASLLTTPPVPIETSAEPVKPFPVFGSVAVPEGNWDQVPETLNHLTQSVASEPIRFELEGAAGEEYFRPGLLNEPQKGFSTPGEGPQAVAFCLHQANRQPANRRNLSSGRRSDRIPEAAERIR